MQNTAQNIPGSDGAPSSAFKIDFAAIVARARAVLTDPKGVWTEIKSEATTIKDLYLGYVMILAAIPPLSEFIGGALFGRSILGFSWRPPIMGSLTFAISTYIFSLIGLYIGAQVVSRLAPMFGGHTTLLDSLKLLAFGSTASYVGGLASLLPMTGIASLLLFCFAIYGLYTLYQGITPMTGVPEAQRVPFTAALVVLMIVIMFIVGKVSAPFRPAPPIPSQIEGVNSEEIQKGLEMLQKMLPPGGQTN